VNISKALDYLITGDHDYDEESFLENIFQILPAHYLQVNLNTGVLSKPKRWWFPSIKERTDLSFEDASKVLRNLFLKSVKLHLRSDVPLGAALSGGIDSSAIVCAIRYLEPNLPIHTFSYVARGSEFDEEKCMISKYRYLPFYCKNSKNFHNQAFWIGLEVIYVRW
jgi:asparagine synthase (glutamine-hydrolysing)